MAKVYYKYDEQTLHYVKVQVGLWNRLYKIVKTALIAIFIALGMVYLYTSYFESPAEVLLKSEIKELEDSHEQLLKQISSLETLMTSIENRDDQVYRTVLGSEPLDKAVRNGGVGGAERFADIRAKKIRSSETILTLHEKIDKLKRKIYIESISQDELLALAKEKHDLLAAVPAIQPIVNKGAVAVASGFGFRMHPFYHVIKMHQGIDFSAPIGTSIFATADGEVIAADTLVSGYGKLVIIDHGFGYQTRYAHLSDFIVKPGDRVKRGELIAYVGNSGQSTAPHLHYEVWLRGMATDPINYFVNDLSPEDYEKMVHLASLDNQSLGN